MKISAILQHLINTALHYGIAIKLTDNATIDLHPENTTYGVNSQEALNTLLYYTDTGFRPSPINFQTYNTQQSHLIYTHPQSLHLQRSNNNYTQPQLLQSSHQSQPHTPSEDSHSQVHLTPLSITNNNSQENNKSSSF